MKKSRIPSSKKKGEMSKATRSKLCAQFSFPLVEWYRKNQRDLPWRRTTDPYAILVSEIMLQQTQVKTVIPYFERWMKQFSSPRALARATEAEVLKSWEGLGYYRRARMLQKAAKEVVELHQGKFPRDLESMANLPGVGPYTLGAVASIAFGLPQPVVDGNVARVLSRWFGIQRDIRQSEVRKTLWSLAERLISPDRSSVENPLRDHPVENRQGAKGFHPGEFNQAMMELGALICLPRNPLCSGCPIRKSCFAAEQELQAKIPCIVNKRETVHQFEFAGLIQKRSEILLYQRSTHERMAEMWQFPSLLLSSPSSDWRKMWKRQFGSWTPRNKLASCRYHVTHHRIDLELYETIENRREGAIFSEGGGRLQWVDVHRAQQLAWISAHRKLAVHFLGWMAVSPS